MSSTEFRDATGLGDDDDQDAALRPAGTTGATLAPGDTPSERPADDELDDIAGSPTDALAAAEPPDTGWRRTSLAPDS